MYNNVLGLVDKFGGRPGSFDDGGGVFRGRVDRQGDGLKMQGFGVEEGRGAVSDAGLGEGYVEVGVVAKDLEKCM